MTDQSLKYFVETELEWNPCLDARIDASHVRVTAESSQVSLEGKVNPWPDRAIVERTAWAVPGVSSLVDHLSVAA